MAVMHEDVFGIPDLEEPRASINLTLGYSPVFDTETRHAEVLAEYFGAFSELTVWVGADCHHIHVKVFGHYKGVFRPISLEFMGPTGAMHVTPQGEFIRLSRLGDMVTLDFI